MLKNNGVKYGLILGVATVAFSVICYLINPKMILTGIAYLAFLIPIFFMYRSSIAERKQNEGLLSFGEALKVTFLTYVIGTFISYVYTYLMFNVFDPSLIDLAREVAIEDTETIAKWMGIEAELDDLPDELDNQDISMGFSMIFMQYLVGLIFPGFVFALIISAITKKEGTVDSVD